MTLPEGRDSMPESTPFLPSTQPPADLSLDDSSESLPNQTSNAVPIVHAKEQQDPADAEVSVAKSPTIRDATSPSMSTIWVAIGISWMLIGISIARHFLLPHIYRCPDGATCHDNLDPRGHIIPRLQTLMQYWHQLGTFLSSIGLSGLIASNARLILSKRNDTTIRSVERSVRAASGKLSDAALQTSVAQYLYRAVCPLWKGTKKPKPDIQHGTNWLGILALSQIAVGLFISFIVGFSIPDLQSTITVNVPFSYRSVFTLPRADIRFPSIEERVVGGVLDDWLIIPSTTRRLSTSFDGSLAVQDNRTLLATNCQVSGSHITGGILCGTQGWNVSILPPDSYYFGSAWDGALPQDAIAYNISSKDYWQVAYSYTSLAAVATLADPILISDYIMSRQYIWASNTSNVLPNATESKDGGIFYTICNHTIFMDNPPVPTELSVQTIDPSHPDIFSDPKMPFTLPCISSDPFICVAWSVDRIISSWWQINIVLSDLIPFSCVGGMLVAFGGISDTHDCTLNNDRWRRTLNTTLSALISAAPLSGNLTQNLLVPTEAINTSWWWTQSILPGTTLLIWLACLVYLRLLRDPSDNKLYKIDLPDIVINQKDLEVDILDARNTKVTVV